MAIITKLAITKGTPSAITLSKTALKAHATVAADSFFADDANWSHVVVEYKNANGQKKHVAFKASQATPTFQFLASTATRSDYQVQSVTIYDKEGGSLKIPRASLTASDFDITFSGGAATGTAYRYIKVQLLESFAGGASGSSAGSSVSVSEFKLKFDGAVQSLSGLSVTGYSPSLGLFSTGTVHNDIVGTANDAFQNWSISFVPDFTIDLTTPKVVTDVLIAPQGDLGAAQVYNVPKKFEVFGSNDGTTFTSIKVVNQTSLTYGQAAGQWYPGQFTSFSLAVVAGPAKFSSSLARSAMTVATDGLSISNAHGDYMYNAYLDKPVTLATAGKFIVEFEIVNSSSYLYFGGSFVSNVSEFTTGNFGEISNGWPLMSSSPEGNKGFNYSNGGPLYIGTTSSGVTFGGFANGDKICLAIDTANHKIWIGKNGVFPSGGDPATNTGGATFSSSETYAYLGLALSNGTVKVVTPSVIPTGFVQL